MKHLHKIATAFCAAALGLLSLTGCEGGDLYNIDSPDWLSEKIDSIKNANQKETVLYTVGETDYTSGWWTAFSKYYVIPDGQTWNATFNLHTNPGDNTYYKNFALVITNDNDRGSAGYKEYGAFRYDFTNDSAKYNSQWGDYLPFKYTTSNQAMTPDANNADSKLQKLSGKVSLTVDRSKPDSFIINISNDGGIVKRYAQPYPLPNLNTSATDNSIRCFLVPEGSYLEFLSTNIVALGDVDAEPESMTLDNVPTAIDQGTDLKTAMAGVTANITFKGNLTKTVDASQLDFFCQDDINTLGEKQLIAVYSKTYVGEAAASPIIATAKFNVEPPIASLQVTKNPTNRRYYYYTTDATSGMTNRTLAFDPTGMEVTATYKDGTTGIVDNSKLSFSPVPATVGTHDVTITTATGVKTTTRVRVAESTSEFVNNVSPTVLGAEDNTTGWWGAHLDADINVPAGTTRQFSFTNYSGKANWNNWVIVLRNEAKHEYGVLRADNFGWGDGYGTVTLSGGQADWGTWLAAMNGAKVSVWVTNVGNGTADVQAVMHGTDGKTYTQYYLGLSTVDPNDLWVDFTVDSDHLVFSNAAYAKRHYAPRHRR